WAEARGGQGEALLIALSAAVDKIIAHFSAARNLVQKAQLGDSRLSPDVGYLLLHTLCPALYALVEDGLKPFQKDVITGQRKNSPWSVVEASVKTDRLALGGGGGGKGVLHPFSTVRVL
uniref:RUN domain-containing protein n=1 Tax=Bubo bubo TaxID=30461 RepID=A0A8C0FDJ1_BUBBB